MFVNFAQIVGRAGGTGKHSASNHGKLFANTYVVPVAVVLAQVAKAFVGIEENVLVPGIRDSFDRGVAALKANDLVVRASKLATRAKRNEGTNVARLHFELLKDGQVRILRVEDTAAAPADNRFRLSKSSERNSRAALGAIERAHLRFRRRSQEWWTCAHHQPSKLRRFFSLSCSNSTNSPK